MTRVVVLDDHAALRKGLAHVLEPHNIEIVGETGASDAEQGMVAAERPDVVMVDLRPERADGIDLVRSLADAENNVIAWGDYHDDRLVERAMSAGARAFLVKNDDIESLVESIQAVADGRRWLPSPASQREIDQLLTSERPQLSRREREILGLLSDGLSTDDVADELSLSSHTVRTHVKNAMRKLDASTRAHAVAIALRDLSIR